jgi:hypothetical protein
LLLQLAVLLLLLVLLTGEIYDVVVDGLFVWVDGKRGVFHWVGEEGSIRVFFLIVASEYQLPSPHFEGGGWNDAAAFVQGTDVRANEAGTLNRLRNYSFFGARLFIVPSSFLCTPLWLALPILFSFIWLSPCIFFLS